MSAPLRNPITKSGFEHLSVIAYDRLPWFIARRVTRLVDFGDGTFLIGWRWSKKGWLVVEHGS